MAASPGGMKTFYLVLAAVAGVGIGFLGYQMLKARNVSIPANVAVLPADTAGFRGYVLGSASAPVEITEYADYQCPSCLDFETITFPDVKTRLIETGQLRWRYRDYPLDQIHPQSRVAAHAAACADDQGKYWAVHQLIYGGQSDWSFRNPTPVMRGYAEAAELDLDEYDACMESAKYAGRIQASLEEGTALGVNSTPTFLIGGRLYPGRLPYDAIRELVDSLAAAQPGPTAPADSAAR